MMSLKRIIKNILISLALLIMCQTVVAVEELSDVDCVIEPMTTIELGSPEEGILSKMQVARGDRVKKGQLVASLDSSLEQINAKLAKYRARTNVRVRSANAEVSFRQKQFDRFKMMLEKKALSLKDFDQAAVELGLALLSAETARTERKVAQIESELVSARLARRSIFSPMDGVVEEVYKSPGEYIHEQAPLMKISQLDSLNIEVFLPVANYGAIYTGLVAEVYPEQPVGGKYAAKVVVVDRVFDPASRTFGVRLELSNSEYKLPAGLRCLVSFKTEIELDVSISSSKDIKE